ncbi:MAG: DUF2079 domain-containing protein [Bacteroidia bacterium]
MRLITNISRGIKRNKAFCIIHAVFLVIYCLITFVNHYNFRTYALDLGIYTNAVYDYAHFRFDTSEMFKDIAQNLLGDHFDPILILISPLYYIFGTVVLLVVQLFFIHLGAIGIYQIALQQLQDKKISLMIMTAFLGFFGVFSAVAYDAHTNVFGAMLLPWMIYYYNSKKWRQSFIVLLLILLCKENMSFWLVFVGLGLAWLHFNDRSKRTIAFVISGISALYFVLITMYVMPALAADGNYTHLRYGVLGNSFGEIFKTILHHPLDTIMLLFKNHLPNPLFDYYKAETHVFVLLSGGLFLFRKPQFILMLAPVYFQKMYHNTPVVWSVSMHYNIEFAPIIAICFITVLSGIRHRKILLTWIYLLLTLAVTIRLCDHTKAYTDKNRIRFYQDGHYQSYYQNSKVYKALKLIPGDAPVSAMNMFVPHLCDREKIYQFPIVKDAEYIIISVRTNTYPLTRKELVDKLIHLHLSRQWKVIYNEDNVFIFKKT